MLTPVTSVPTFSAEFGEATPPPWRAAMGNARDWIGACSRAAGRGSTRDVPAVAPGAASARSRS